MDHPDTMVAVSNLGYLLKLQGKPAEAAQGNGHEAQAARWKVVIP